MKASEIPITEQWLLKFGFVSLDGYFFLPDGNIFITDNFAIYLDHPENASRLRYVKYVHQLQNLYYALTSEELTIQPNSSPDSHRD